MSFWTVCLYQNSNKPLFNQAPKSLKYVCSDDITSVSNSHYCLLVFLWLPPSNDHKDFRLWSCLRHLPVILSSRDDYFLADILFFTWKESIFEIWKICIQPWVMTEQDFRKEGNTKRFFLIKCDSIGTCNRDSHMRYSLYTWTVVTMLLHFDLHPLIYPNPQMNGTCF